MNDVLGIHDHVGLSDNGVVSSGCLQLVGASAETEEARRRDKNTVGEFAWAADIEDSEKGVKNTAKIKWNKLIA